jgi:hypothetical protein
MRTTNVILTLLITGFATFIHAADRKAAQPSREAIEWCDIWISHANEANLPRVLLIGDSIARDYYHRVEKHFAGKAFVARLATSRFVADPVLHKEIELVLSGMEFDVILFNNGMHGWQHSEETYRKAFPKLVKTIRSNAPKAKLLWATTTPLRNGRDITGDHKAEYSDERIEARNAIACDIVSSKKISTVDLYRTVKGRPNIHSDNVHFNGDGNELLAAEVCKALEALLPDQASPGSAKR